jgi:uncharacterized circularly permuted ATP-grasp superfamily protein
VSEADLAELAASVEAATHEAGLVFGGGGGPRTFRIDPIPRLLAAEEWSRLQLALSQRIRALDAFVADMHGERTMLAAGRIPESVLRGASFVEPDLFGLDLPGPWISIAGLDLVRDGHGELRVLEDNLRTPSGLGYALGARRAVERWLPAEETAAGGLADHITRLLAGVLADPPPAVGNEEGLRVLLSDGPGNSAWYEQQLLAEMLGVPLVTIGQLRRRGDRLNMVLGGQPVHVVYRRTDEERIRLPDGSLTHIGELLLEPLRAGRVRLVNRFGTGVADDKLVCPYVEAMIEFYLGERPRLRTVETFDLGQREIRERALERLRELVVKPRDGHGGVGVLIGPHASPQELAGAEAAIRADPERWLAQELVTLSTHPTVIDGVLEPRHIDLRPFAFYDGRRVELLPGGLTRVAYERGSLVVNSSRQGGGKDTRILP